MAEAAAILTRLGWVVLSPLMKLLFDRAQKLLGTSIDERMEMLEAIVLPRLSVAIENAEKSRNKDMLVAWLERFNDAYYTAEEAIDLLEYELLERKVMNNKTTLMQKIIKFEAGTLLSRVSKIKLKGHIDKLIEIAKEANEFRHLFEASENVTTSNLDRETTSETLGKVFGREKDREFIADFLKEEPLISEPGPSITPVIPTIAIMGRFGIGKTTLAQYVYGYMEEQGYFDLLLWVYLPRKFKAVDVVRNIVQNIRAKDGALHVGDYDLFRSLDSLGAQIKGMLGSKKFLLILDDFWCDTVSDIEQWEMFIRCLSTYGSRGSKILLTTQSRLASTMKIKTYTLQELEESQFLDLFMHHAWSSDCFTFMQREEFKTIGCKIAAKLKGDPGAAKMVGRQLRNNPNLRYWENIEKKDLLGDSRKAWIWSYQQLPVHLQRCFAFCCLFPKGYRFSGLDLIRLWMAEGFIKPIDTEDRMEDIGENYLNELVSRFFIEQDADYRNRTYYRLHDLLHDLAERVQGDNFLRIEYTNSKDVFEYISKKLVQSEKIRHIYLPVCAMNILKDIICGMKNLRTVLCVESNCIVPKEVLVLLLREILESSKKLKVLCLPNCVEDLPDCIGHLKHLRYLNLTGSQPFMKLPVSICKLYLLQTLFLPNCESLVSLPKEFCQLVSLRNIIIEGDMMSHISYVGRLTSLQGNLNQITVGKKHAHELQQLENLNQITGRMCTCLENVNDIDDAVMANMPSKIEVLKRIGRMRNLQTLDFRNYSGSARVHDSIWNIETLTQVILDDKFEGPPSTAYLPKLQTLKTVRFREEWTVNGWPKMPSIRALRLYNIYSEHDESFHIFLNGLDHLRSLHISVYPFLYEVLDMSTFPSYNYMQSLRVEGKWDRKHWNQLMSTNRLDIRLFPIHLIKLTLCNSQMEEDPMPVLEKLKDLRKLTLDLNAYIGKQLSCSAGGFPQLKYLKLSALKYPENWKVENGGMPRLQEIFIITCKKLVVIPELQRMTSINNLTVREVHPDLLKRLKEEQYDKLKHIPFVEIFE